MRLIDLDSEYVSELLWRSGFPTRESFVEWLNQAPHVDAVPVVRCKDCKYGDYDSQPDSAMVCLRTKDGFWRKETDFCSYGESQHAPEERRKDETS